MKFLRQFFEGSRYETADSRLERKLRVRIAQVNYRVSGLAEDQQQIVDGLVRELSNLTARVGRLEAKLREAGSVSHEWIDRNVEG